MLRTAFLRALHIAISEVPAGSFCERLIHIQVKSGGLGIQSAEDAAGRAFFASWAACGAAIAAARAAHTSRRTLPPCSRLHLRRRRPRRRSATTTSRRRRHRRRRPRRRSATTTSRRRRHRRCLPRFHFSVISKTSDPNFLRT
jgi:hypothetical protein